MKEEIENIYDMNEWKNVYIKSFRHPLKSLMFSQVVLNK